MLQTHFYKKIIVEDHSLKEPLVFTEKVAKFSLGDFTEMFAYQGLQMQEVFGECPQCGSHQMQVTGGTEMRVKELEVA